MPLQCNRGACETGRPATWWNSSTRAFYCITCARQINQYNPGLCVERPRDARQAEVYKWVGDTFGPSAQNPTERVLRFIEEAIELAQAEGLTSSQVLAVLNHVYAKAPGSIESEVGGVGVTLLGYCAVRGISADEMERKEAERVFKIDPAYFRKRHDIKAAAGIATFSSSKEEG